MKFSISNKIILFIVFPFTLILGVYTFYLVTDVQESVEEIYITNNTELVYAYANTIDEFLLRAMILVENRAAFLESSLIDLSEEEIYNQLKDLVSDDDLVYGAVLAFAPNIHKSKELFAPYVIADSGGFIAFDLAQRIDYTGSEREWYSIPAKTKKPYWTRPYLAPAVGNKPLITYSYPIVKEGVLQAILEVDIDLVDFGEFLMKRMSTQQGRFIVVDSAMQYIYHPDVKRIATLSLSGDTSSVISQDDRQALVNALNKKSNGYMSVWNMRDNETQYAFYATMQNVNWTVLIYTGENAITAPIQDVFDTSLFIMLMMLAGVGILITLFSKKLLRPVKSIGEFARSVAAGDYESKIAIRSGDEFEGLAGELNAMSSMLKERREALLQANSELEQKVTERTAALQESLIDAKKLTAAVEQSPVLVTITDTDGMVHYVNPEYCKVTGYATEEMTGRLHPLLSTGVITPSTFDRYKAVLRSGQKIKGEIEGVKKNGAKYWIRISGVGVEDERNEVKNFVFVEDDITKTKVAEIQLKQQHTEISLRNKYIVDSLNYAKRIQNAILPTNEQLTRLFRDLFVYFSPKDEVSGDFFWIAESENKRFLAVVDCTGHGVPGALMSMIGNTLLNEIVTVMKIHDPGKVLNELDFRVKKELQKSVNRDTYDGMDIILCVWDICTHRISVAMANRKLYYIQNDVLSEIKGERKSIGDAKRDQSFTTHFISAESETVLYLFTDGITDQNNSENKKYGAKGLKKLLTEIYTLPMDDQYARLLTSMQQFAGNEPQRDDMTLLGVRIPGVHTGEVLLRYDGVVTQERLIDMTQELTDKLEKITPQKSARKIVFAVNELLQNISRYSEKREAFENGTKGIGSVLVLMRENQIHIRTANAASAEKIETLKSTLQAYNEMSKEALHGLKKELLRREVSEQGAGIGLLEIIRRNDAQLLVCDSMQENGECLIVFTISLNLGVIHD